MTARCLHRGPSTVVAALAFTLLVPVPQALASPVSPDEQPAVTPQLLAESVKTFSLDGAVKVWAVDGSVTGLESETRDGKDTVVALDSDIAFAFAKADLAPAAERRIAALVARLPRQARVSVTGHTDSIGDDASNLALSRRRARAVADAVQRSRPDLRLAVTGRGEADPAAPNTVGGRDNPEGRSKNRRVELRFTS